MKNITLKIIVSLICCSLIIALILSGSAVTQSRNVLQDEVKKELLYASQKYANQFSTGFETQEKVVDHRLPCRGDVNPNRLYEKSRQNRLDGSLKNMVKLIKDFVNRKPRCEIKPFFDDVAVIE